MKSGALDALRARRGLIPYALAVLVFTPLLAVSLFYDDAVYILHDPSITMPWPGFGKIFLGGFARLGEYEPLPFLWHRALYQAFGAAPFAYRCGDLIAHGLVLFLLFRLVRRLTRNDDQAFWVTLLYAALPSHVEVLAVTSFDKHVGVALSALAVLNIAAGAAKASPGACAAAATALAAGTFCKESALMIPFAVVALDWAMKRTWRDRRNLHTALWGAAGAYVLFRLFVVPRKLEALASLAGFVPATSAKIFLWHTTHALIPVGLSLEHSVQPVASAFSGETAALGVGLLLAAGVSAAVIRRDRLAGFGLILWAIMIAPFLNLIPYLNYSLVAERYRYFAAAGLLLALVRLAWPLKPKARASIFISLVTVYALTARTYALTFADPLEMWARAAAFAPLNPRAHSEYGMTLLKRGRLDEAERELTESLRLDARVADVCLDLTQLYAKQGRFELARRSAVDCAKALGNYDALYSAGALEFQLGNFAAACPWFAKARNLAPYPGEADMALGQCLAATGDPSGAESSLTAAIAASASPDVKAGALFARSRLRADQNRLEEAAADAAGALFLSPNDPQYIDGMAQLERRQGHEAKAVALYDEALAAWTARREAYRATGTPEALRAMATINGILTRLRAGRAGEVKPRASAVGAGGSAPRPLPSPR